MHVSSAGETGAVFGAHAGRVSGQSRLLQYASPRLWSQVRDRSGRGWRVLWPSGIRSCQNATDVNRTSCLEMSRSACLRHCPHLASMALFKVNTGCREREVCRCNGSGRWSCRN